MCGICVCQIQWPKAHAQYMCVFVLFQALASIHNNIYLQIKILSAWMVCQQMLHFRCVSYLVVFHYWFWWSWKWAFSISPSIIGHILVIMFGDAVDLSAKLMFSVSWLVVIVTPGFLLLSLGLVFHWDADCSPVSYFATYVACLIFGRTMFSTKTVGHIYNFWIPVCSFYPLLDVGE